MFKLIINHLTLNINKMAFNKKNFLMKVLVIQQITIDHQAKGVTKEWIYENIIFHNYFISRGTYFNYLTVNARKQLRELGVDWEELKTKSEKL